MAPVQLSLLKAATQSSWDDPIVDSLRALVRDSGGLAVFSTVTGDRVPASLINAGVIKHPSTGAPCVAHVAMGDSLRLRRLEKNPGSSVTFHVDRKWLTVEGGASILYRASDPRAGRQVGQQDRAQVEFGGLLRSIYVAAGGGEHPDWEEYDEAMARESRAVVFLSLGRVYGNYSV